MIFTAQLTGCRRNVGTAYPKALLTHIRPNNQLNREHCWVVVNDVIAAHQPYGHQAPKLITFEATIVNYTKRGTEPAQTLAITKIISIKSIPKKKKKKPQPKQKKQAKIIRY